MTCSATLGSATGVRLGRTRRVGGSRPHHTGKLASTLGPSGPTAITSTCRRPSALQLRLAEKSRAVPLNKRLTRPSASVTRTAGSPYGRRTRPLSGCEPPTASVRETGLQQPIEVRPDLRPGRAGRYLITLGERRYRAATEAGLAAIPVIIRPVSEHDALFRGLTENLQRQDLSPEDLRRTGERVVNARRLFDVREAWPREGDLPAEVLAYENARGWDAQGVVPWSLREALGLTDLPVEVRRTANGRPG